MPTFAVNGITYDVATKLNLGELRLVKKISGLNITELQSEAEAGNPDALVALMHVSMLRMRPGSTVAELEELDLESITFTEDEAPTVPPSVAEPDAAV